MKDSFYPPEEKASLSYRFTSQNSPPHITKSSKTIYFLLFNSHLIHGCQIWGQEYSNEFKKIGILQEKAIRTIKFLPNDALITETMKESKILKLKDLTTLQNILFVKDSLINEGMTSFDKIFQQSTTTCYQNTRSASSFQLWKRDFKTEKYGQFFIINKGLLDWNQLQKHLKTSFKYIKGF